MSDLLSGFGFGLDILNGLSGTISNLSNTFNGYDKRQKRLEGREDSAVQRRVADLRAAGLSPTLAAGGAANSGMVASSPIQTDLGSKGIQQALLRTEIESRMADIAKTKSDKALVDAQVADYQDYVERQRLSVDASVHNAETARLSQQTTRDLGLRNAQISEFNSLVGALESLDRSESRSLERDIQNWNLAFADKHDLPYGQQNTGIAGQLVQAFDLLAAWKKAADKRQLFTWEDMYNIFPGPLVRWFKTHLGDTPVESFDKTPPKRIPSTPYAGPSPSAGQGRIW